MDLGRESVALCAEGTQAEFAGRLDDARGMYRRAWEAAADDHDRAVAAHYVAHLERDVTEQLRWNQAALDSALRVQDGSAEALMGSLYVNIGHSHELIGDHEEAERYYVLAARHGVTHRPE